MRVRCLGTDQFFDADLPSYLTTTKSATVATAASSGSWPRTVTATIRRRNTSALLAGVPVTVRRRSGTGTTVTTVGTYKTDAAGKVAYTFSPKTPTVVTFAYAGSTTWTTVVSGRTSSYGNYYSTQQPKRATYYRFSFPGVAGRYVRDYSPGVYVAY